MIKILKFIAFILAVAVSGILIMAAMKPDHFRVERSMSIQASPDRIFARINTMQNWRAWSPWENLDPDMKRTFSGPPSGVGSKYAWEGDKNIGIGSTEITEAVLFSKIALKLDFLKPFEAHNNVEFTLEPKGDATEVTWAMHGPQPFMAKVMSVIFNCDKMVGGQFETGLANLKKVAES